MSETKLVGWKSSSHQISVDSTVWGLEGSVRHIAGLQDSKESSKGLRQAKKLTS